MHQEEINSCWIQTPGYMFMYKTLLDKFINGQGEVQKDPVTCPGHMAIQ